MPTELHCTRAARHHPISIHGLLLAQRHQNPCVQRPRALERDPEGEGNPLPLWSLTGGQTSKSLSQRLVGIGEVGGEGGGGRREWGGEEGETGKGKGLGGGRRGGVGYVCVWEGGRRWWWDGEGQEGGGQYPRRCHPACFVSGLVEIFTFMDFLTMLRQFGEGQCGCDLGGGINFHRQGAAPPKGSGMRHHPDGGRRRQGFRFCGSLDRCWGCRIRARHAGSCATRDSSSSSGSPTTDMKSVPAAIHPA